MARTDFKPLTYGENAIDETAVKDRLGALIERLDYEAGQPVLTVKRENWVEAARVLREDPALAYEHFTDITCADLSKKDDFEPERRFQLVAILYSVQHKRRVRLKAYIPEQDPRCASLTSVFRGANLTEREVFEMFGITFTGHPNLKRLLTPDYMKDFPLRKEYPVHGKGERDNFPRYEEIQ